jgi:hypothetical protein
VLLSASLLSLHAMINESPSEYAAHYRRTNACFHRRQWLDHRLPRCSGSVPKLATPFGLRREASCPSSSGNSRSGKASYRCRRSNPSFANTSLDLKPIRDASGRGVGLRRPNNMSRTPALSRTTRSLRRRFQQRQGRASPAERETPSRKSFGLNVLISPRRRVLAVLRLIKLGGAIGPAARRTCRGGYLKKGGR